MTSTDIRTLIYTGKSMSGTFRQGDLLYMEPTVVQRVKSGDVVVYRRHQSLSGEGLVVHRVVGKGRSGLLVQGDANGKPDLEPVTDNNLAGRVIRCVRKGNRLSLFGNRIFMPPFPRRGMWNRLKRYAGRFFPAAMRESYRRLRRQTMLCGTWRQCSKKARFYNRKGEFIKYVLVKRSVACYCAGESTRGRRRQVQLPLKDDLSPGKDVTGHAKADNNV